MTRPQQLTLMVLVSILLCIGDFARSLRAETRIVDGDTIHHEGERIRIYGLDCAELRAPGGLAAKVALEVMLSGKQITLKRRGQDRYGRVVAKVFADGRDVTCQMIRSGACVEYKRYSRGEYEGCK